MPHNPDKPDPIDPIASAGAPFISFDNPAAVGVLAGTGTIALAATRFLHPMRDAMGQTVGIAPDTVVVAHLRGTLPALRRLRDAINEVERLMQTQAEIASHAGGAVATVQ